MQQRRLMLVGVLMVVVAMLAATGVSAETLTLRQCIDMALQGDGSSVFGVPRARISYHQAKQNVWSRWGALLPSFSHNYNYSWQKFPSGQIFDPTIGQFIQSPAIASTSWSTSFSVGNTFFDGGANWYRVAQAYHDRAASRENLRAIENRLVLGVKERYFALLKSQRLVEVQEAAVRRAEEFLKTIESRYELGSASLSEVLKAKVQLGTAQVELLRSENLVESGRADLNTVLNRSVDAPLEIADVLPEGIVLPSYDEAVNTAIDESPDMRASRAVLRSAKDNIGIARATLFPSFSWSVRRLFTPANRDGLLDFDGKDGTWFANASLNFTLFSGFHRKTQISNAKVNVKYTRESLKQTEKAVALAVKQAYLAVQLADETKKLADQTEVSAQEDFSLAQEKYNLGAATILDLLDAQVSLSQAQSTKVTAEYDYYTAIARLENAMGLGR